MDWAEMVERMYIRCGAYVRQVWSVCTSGMGLGGGLGEATSLAGGGMSVTASTARNARDACIASHPPFCRWCERNGFMVKVVERQAGDEAGIKSSEVEVQVSVCRGRGRG